MSMVMGADVDGPAAGLEERQDLPSGLPPLYGHIKNEYMKSQSRYQPNPSISLFDSPSDRILVDYKVELVNSRSMSISGVILWKNGEKFVIQEALVQAILKRVNQQQKGRLYIVRPHNSKDLRVKSKQRTLRPVACFQKQAAWAVGKLTSRLRSVLGTIQEFTGTNILSAWECEKPQKYFIKKLKMKQKFISSYRKMVRAITATPASPDSSTSSLNGLKLMSEPSIIKYPLVVEETEEIDESMCQMRSVQCTKKFFIDTKLCKISTSTSGEDKETTKVQQKLLSIKKINPELEGKKKARRIDQLNEGITMLKQIKLQRRFFLEYYLPHHLSHDQQKVDQIFMEHIPDCLAFFTLNRLLTIGQTFHFFRNIVQGVRALHGSGVVHRDMKPENILLPDMAKHYNSGPSCIKIIDFSDSALVSAPFTQQHVNRLGCTLPYSPFECNYCCPAGLNDPRIDLWSVGVLLYELLNGDHPPIKADFMPDQFRQGIKRNQFTFIPLQSRLRPPNSISNMVQRCSSLLLYGLIKLKPEDRLALDKVQAAALELEHLFSSIDTFQ